MAIKNDVDILNIHREVLSYSYIFDKLSSSALLDLKPDNVKITTGIAPRKLAIMLLGIPIAVKYIFSRL